MASRKDAETNGQASGKLTVIDGTSHSLPWEQQPLCWLNPQQQVQFQHQAETHRYTLGQKIWSTDGPKNQFFVVSGKVRLREEGNSKPLATLEAGDWFGDLLEFGLLKAVAASKEVLVVRWDAALWQEAASTSGNLLEIEQFWRGTRSRYLPQTTDTLQISSYPFVPSVNTAAACLTMAAQQLQLSTQLEWVQRQLRGQKPKHLVEAGEKLGLGLKRLITTWNDLPQLSFHLLLYLPLC